MPSIALARAGAEAARPASQPQILLPTRGAVACAGTNLLSGQELSPRLRTRRERAAWSYKAGGLQFTPAPGGPSPSAPPESFLYQRLWDTSQLPSGRIALRLKLGNRTATTRFQNDLPPRVSLLQARPMNGQVELAVDASDPEGGPLMITWYFGDGTVVTDGTTVRHTYAPGDYVVMLRAIDRRGCSTLRVHQLHVPLAAPTTLSETAFCDPLRLRVTFRGRSDQKWPGIRERGESLRAPLSTKLLGRLVNRKRLGFGFEVTAVVFGNPYKCTADQSFKGIYDFDQKTSVMGFSKRGHVKLQAPPDRNGPFQPFGYDDYGRDYRLRRTAPSPAGDGTATISWIDYPSLPLQPNADTEVTNAQIRFQVIDRITGSEASIAHGALEQGGSAMEGTGPGETAFVHFRTCVVLHPPKGTRKSLTELVDAKGPDGAVPADVSQRERSVANAPRQEFGFSQIMGC